jgi:hypothetical protein
MSDVYSGNFASQQTDQITRATLEAAIPRALLTGAPGPNQFKFPKPYQCPPYPVNQYTGGTTSGLLLANQIRATELCTAANELAVAKLRQIPGCPINNAERFAQYKPFRPPAPCPVSTINPAIPKALDGPCTNVIGIVQTWPPH